MNWLLKIGRKNIISSCRRRLASGNTKNWYLPLISSFENSSSRHQRTCRSLRNQGRCMLGHEFSLYQRHNYFLRRPQFGGGGSPWTLCRHHRWCWDSNDAVSPSPAWPWQRSRNPRRSSWNSLIPMSERTKPWPKLCCSSDAFVYHLNLQTEELLSESSASFF